MHATREQIDRRRVVGGVIGIGLAAAGRMVAAAPERAGLAAAQAADTTPPAELTRVVSEPVLAGEGELRFFGLRIYAARLWVGPRFDAANFAAFPLALELTYHRAFSGAAIAGRSIEEIERQQELPSTQASRWRQALTALIPDVAPGDRLTGVYQPDQGLTLVRDDRVLGAIADTELARRFVGIWLSPATSEPALRERLLARLSGATR